MKIIKRLFCLLLVLSLLFTSGLVEVLAIRYQHQEKQTDQPEVQKEVFIADVSDMFVVEQTTPENTEPEVAKPETTKQEATESEIVVTPPVQKEPTVTVIKQVTAQEFTCSVLSDNTCRIDGYTGTATALVIPDTLEGYPVTAIGNNAFKNKSTLESITLPDSVTSIGNYAFESCTALKSIDLGTSLTHIGQEALKGCTGLTVLALPNTVQEISYRAFANCTSLSEFTYPANLKSVSGGYGDSGIFVGCTALKSVAVPEGVTAIPANVFYGAAALESVSLPSTLLSIGNNAFAISGITSLDLPDGVTTIGNYAFESCTALKSIDLGTSLLSIGSGALKGCTALTELDLPDTVESIGIYAFKGCTSLASFSYPANLKTVDYGYGTGIFTGCTALKTIAVPEGVTAIPANVFYGAAALESVSLPSTLTSIGNYAFSRCAGLTAITLPSTVNAIGSEAFSNCTALESFIMSDQVTELHYNTFYGCSNLKNLHLSLSLERISNGCFAYCTSLKTICIPPSVTYIHTSAFNGVSDITFHCALNSYAAEYALDRQIPIVPMSFGNEETVTRVDSQNSYYIHNYDGLSAAGVMSMVVHYELEDVTASPKAITVHVYDFAALQENTILLNNELCTNYEYDEETGRLTVPVQASSGTLRFCLKPLRYEALTSYARLIFSDDKVELIGSVNTVMPVLNISARKETSLSTVAVNGLAVPETEVSLYVDGLLVKTITANKVGDYSAEISLGNPIDGKKYTITAKATDRSGTVVTAQTDVTYRQKAPELQKFMMIHGSSKVSLLGLQGTRPVITFRNSAFRFEVGFSNPEGLGNVYVVSTRNNVKKSLKAEWNEELGLFVAEGYFDPNDHSYVPGNISLEYSYKREKISFNQVVDFSAEAESLPQVWKDADIDILENTESDLKLDITIGENEERFSFQYSMSVQQMSKNFTEQDALNSNFTRIEDDYGNVLYYQDNLSNYNEIWGDKPCYTIHDFTAGVTKEYYVDNFKNYVGDIIGSADGAGLLFDAVGVVTAFTDQIEFAGEIDEYRRMVANDPTLTAEQKQECYRLADNAYDGGTSIAAIKFILSAASIGATIFCPAAGPVLAATSVVFGLLADYAMAEYKHDMYAAAFGMNYKFKWAIDPSGYVYDRVTGQRLEGVTVHAYWIENTGDDPDFWNNKPGEDEYGVLWDSMDFSQMNPLLTDGDGCYAWDVPEGWWRVSYEKEGYVSTWSEWLPVPPPQTEVNIGLMPIGGAVLGDLTGDGSVNNKDVEYLLWYTLFPANYPISQNADYNNDGSVNNKDVEYLLWFTLFPDNYPLGAQ